MYERLKQIRESMGMNQSEFAKKLGMGQSTLAMMEVGKRDILDRHIKTICSIFNVSEEWLRNGTGEMFKKDEESALSALAAEYDLDELDKRIIEGYLSLSPTERQAIKKYIESVAAAYTGAAAKENEIDKEVEEYRRELELEKSSETSSVLPDSSEEIS